MTWVVPNEDAVTLGELNGELYSVSKRDDAHAGDAYIRFGGCVFPPAQVSCPKPRQSSKRESLSDKEDEELHPGALGLLKRAFEFTKILLTQDELSIFNSVLSAAGRVVHKLKAAMEEEDLVLQPSDASTKNSECIVDLSWHPARNVLAVAQRDGVVAMYHVESATWDTRVLEHPKQMNITSIEWGKFTSNTLAVACSSGIFLWKVPQKDKEPALQEILLHSGKEVFSYLCWNADGSLLAALTTGSKTVTIFDTIFSRMTELQSPYVLTSLHWSPTGEYLFVLTEAGVSLMWETLTWKREIWEVAAGSCGWSNDGRCLLVGLRNNHLLYPYIFQDFPPSIDAHIGSPPLDFAEVKIFSLDRSTSANVGGKVQDISWDPSGARIAVTYRTADHQAQTAKLIAIFSVTRQPFLIFTRTGLLRGPPNAGVPRKLAFASTFEHGALLSVAWSSGLISFHPFYLKCPTAS